MTWAVPRSSATGTEFSSPVITGPEGREASGSAPYVRQLTAPGPGPPADDSTRPKPIA